MVDVGIWLPLRSVASNARLYRIKHTHRGPTAAGLPQLCLCWWFLSPCVLKTEWIPQLLCNLAALLIEYKQDFEEAEKCYKLALDCDPGHVNAMINYGK